jgi:hypothetical protein
MAGAGMTVRALTYFAAFTALASVAILNQSRGQSIATPAETEQEKKERDIRNKCAAAVCSTLRNRRPATGDVTCEVQKTWRKDILVKIMSRTKISWPWGDTRCSGALKLDRPTLIKAMAEPEFEAQFAKHAIRCEIESGNDKYDVALEMQPRVTFKQGKAVKASLNWGKIEAPALAKSALWSATAADNSFGVLQSTVVEDINTFIEKRCMEVKKDWEDK